MKNKLILPILIACAILVPTCAAFTATHKIMPDEGDYDDPFLVWVRTNPYREPEQMYIYVFWDDVPLIHRQKSPTFLRATLEHRWDITLTPPPGFTEIGKHDIDIWLEKASGETIKIYDTYTITETIPDLTLWDEFIDKYPDVVIDLQGPQGVPGPLGPAGPKGDQGVGGQRGVKGVDGIVGDRGSRGYAGADGVVPTLTLITLFFGSTIATVIIMIMLTRRGLIQ